MSNNTRIYMAPIKGITDCIYRNTYSRYFKGVDVAIAPFISSTQSRKMKPSYLHDILPKNNKEMPLIPQILSNDPDDFLFIAQRIFELGWTEINWNLGCPTPMVANKRRGSGLLPDPATICRVLEKVLAIYPKQISIKVRLGRNSPNELAVLLPLLNQYPLQEIIIHPRLGIQMYKGIPDLEAFGNCVSLTSHKVVYNGDIVDLRSFLRLQDRFQINNWMIGRGLLRNPFLTAQIKKQGISLKTSRERDILRSFHDDLFEQYQARLCGPSHILGRMKGLWVYFADFFVKNKANHKRIKKTKGINEYIEVVDDIFYKEELDEQLKFDGIVKSRKIQFCPKGL